MYMCTYTACGMIIVPYRQSLIHKERQIHSLVQGIRNVGKGLDEVKRKQQKRKLSVLHDACQSALQFIETFNIDLLSVSFQCRTSIDNIVKLDYNKEILPSTYNSTSAAEPENTHAIYQVLFLLDKFAVSDEFFHEVAMLLPNDTIIQ